MERPNVVVVEQRDYPHRDVYEEEIESCIAAGYQVVLRRRHINPEAEYTVLEDQEEPEDEE